MQGGLGLPDRDYYLSSDPTMAKLARDYTPYVAEDPDARRLSRRAGARADRIVALETKIAQAHEPLEAEPGLRTRRTIWTRADFDKKAPGIDWDRLLGAAQLGSQQDFIVWQPGADPEAGRAGRLASRSTCWKDWLAFHRINQMTRRAAQGVRRRASSLSTAPTSTARRSSGRATSAALDVAQRRARRRGRQALRRQLFPGLVEGRHRGHGQQHQGGASTSRIEALDVDGAGDQGRSEEEGRRRMVVGVGYPDKWRDYARLDDPRRRRLRQSRARAARRIISTSSPRSASRSTERMVDDAADGQRGEPAAAERAQLPGRDPRQAASSIPNADAAANYGAIGSVIGHEISHSFDNLGAHVRRRRASCATGGRRPTSRISSRPATALAAQYDAYEALPGLHLNGKQELGENIADVAGLAAAYDA